ncbi:MAG: AAA family ATPase [Candidatus Aenigmarchaeota archaeon]|nr:AAA family ATPase [Candidatus Aenigmarchaeota archaeon]
MSEFKVFNWETNPFTFRIDPELFVGYDSETKRITSSVKDGEKFTMLVGPTGSGKTSMIKYLITLFTPTHKVIFLPKPPKNPDDFVKIFKEITRSFLDRFKSDGTSLYNLSDKVNEKLNVKKCVLFVDEMHEASTESLEWLRTLTDQIDNLSIIVAGLPVIEEILKENLETFSRRINNKLELTNLSKHEIRELIKKRIEKTGGEDIKPFTGEAIDNIFEKTGGFPRDVLKMCNNLVQEAVSKNMSTIDNDFIREEDKTEPKVSMEAIKELPDRQKSIFETLEGRELTPSEVVSNMESDGYKNKDNAIRSINNLLRRMMADGIVERKKIGKTYKYKVAGKYETLMVKA